MKKLKELTTNKSKAEIRKLTTSLHDFLAKYNKKERQCIEQEARYYEILFLIKENRIKLGYTQEQLSQISKIPRVTITNIESGKRNVTVNTLMVLAEAMGKKLTIKLS